MTTDLVATADREQAAGALAHILATGDLAALTNEQRVAYYLDLCASLALSPRSRPFDWLVLDKRLVLYPNKSCAEQLRRLHQISVKVVRREMAGELHVVEVEGRTPSGRVDRASKYVPVTYYDERSGQRRQLVGEKLAWAYAKAETGAKRRLVLSMVGLAGIPDQDELTHGRPVIVDGTGQVLTQPTEEQRYLAATPAAAATIGEPTFESTAERTGARSPLAGTASQAPTSAELARPPHERDPEATFRPSDDDIHRWLGAWHATVKGTSLATDDARHRFFEQWSDGRTASSRNWFASATERQASDLLAHARALADDERQAIAAASAADDADDDEAQEPF